MSKTGKVVSWKGPFGFVEAEDGTSVYIHTSEIEGGRLRIGLNVSFDIEDGKDGKPKGTNVSGEAILAKGEKLSDEDFEADRKRIAEIKEASVKKEFEPAWKLVEEMSRSNRRHMARMLAKDLGVELSKDEDKRADPSQKTGEKFSKGEFIAFYGKQQGEAMWAKASTTKRKRNRRGDKKEKKDGEKDEEVKEEKKEEKEENKADE